MIIIILSLILFNIYSYYILRRSNLLIYLKKYLISLEELSKDLNEHKNIQEKLDRVSFSGFKLLIKLIIALIPYLVLFFICLFMSIPLLITSIIPLFSYISILLR